MQGQSSFRSRRIKSILFERVYTKMLNCTEITVCRLISIELFGNKEPLPKDIEWEKVFKELEAHAILGLFRKGIDSYDLPIKIKNDWEDCIYSIIAYGAKIAAGQRELGQLLIKNNVQYMIIKGTAVSQYYPIKNSRTLGDVDFIVKDVDYKKTQKLMAEAKYDRVLEDEESPRHVSYYKNGIHFECHHVFARDSFAFSNTINKLISENIEHAERISTEYGIVMSPQTAINGLVLIVHIAIHLNSGLGLRQIIDWLLYAKMNLTDPEWLGENGRVIRETGMENLAKAVTKAGQMYFGLSSEITWCSDAPDEICGELIQLVFSYGNFGNKNKIDDKIIGIAQSLRRGVFHNLKASGEHNWKILNKYPFLKFLAPLYQIGRYTKQILSNKGAYKMIFYSKKRVDERDKLMRYLGL